MLTRRHIRIKVMQSVYSFNIGQQNKLEQEVLFFKESVEQTFNLYLLLLGLLKSLHAYADEQLVITRKNKIQSEDQINALQKFTQNRVLLFLKDHEILAKQLDNKKLVKWDLEFKFLKDLFKSVSASQVFLNYVELSNPSVEEDLKFVAKMFKNQIATSNYLYDYVEDNCLTWADDLPMVNTFLLKMLKHIDVNSSQTLTFPRPSENKEDTDFGIQLLEKVIANDSKLQEELLGKTPNWDAERIAQLDNVILKVAIAELLYFPMIPSKVTLNEYLEIAKDYSTPKSNNFVNGVLDKLVKEFDHENRLNKTGRGLL
ncbi:transcription antitermination factor NusB [Flavobacteriaceae bacterium]|nr:transcription antitermination factor NusB [Flavobacteriaceae bacterium]MDA9812026.1 transcription antitermination factor NusB [Flavobacteriaceae bacterium]MDB4270216.1 transcription antitermination factor NusB [Flavobacteriaceae bacterium]MDC1543746.1 transcription antitermination factor NusB [Flavobacteriaceae bacterium]MDO7570546.1 transcription antitermination factor NusB [Flavobacteriaceae bacterium]